jgi:biopolymer transport protein ExbD
MPKLEPMQQPAGRTGGRRARAMKVSTSLAEINIVPLVDVMLVLLVIFMVAAPMMNQGFPVKLPESQRSQIVERPPVTVTVPSTFRTDQRVRLGQDAVPLEALAERVKQALASETSRDVLLASDGTVQMQDVIMVMDRLYQAGVRNVGIQTQPPAGRR